MRLTRRRAGLSEPSCNPGNGNFFTQREPVSLDNTAGSPDDIRSRLADDGTGTKTEAKSAAQKAALRLDA